MRRNLKIWSLILFIVLSINVVRAEENNCDITLYTADTGYRTGSYFGGGPIVNYTFSGTSKINGTHSYTAYCHNPGVSTTFNSSGEKVQCKVVFDPTSKDLNKNTFGAGLNAILDSGESESIIYVASNLYKLLWPTYDSSGKGEEIQTKILRKYINDYLKDDEIKDILKQLNKKISKTYLLQHEFDASQIATCESNCESKETMASAKKLMQKGLEAALKYATDGSASVTVSDDPKTSKKTEKDENGVENYVQTLTYVVDINNFSGEKSSVKLNFECSNCAELGVNTKLYLDDKEITASDLANKNLVEEFVKDGDGKVNFKIEFRAPSDKYLCEQINYAITLRYYEESLSKSIYEASKCGRSDSCQGFYVIEKNTNNSEDTRERSVKMTHNISLCSLSCVNVKDMCDAGNERACNRFREEFKGKCITCTSSIPDVECNTCKTGNHEIDIVEGYNIDASTCQQPKEEDLDIKSCIADDNASDTAGNPYKVAQLSDASTYANVYCKEDYHMTLPGSIITESGSYFTLRATIEGTKRCYTNEIVPDGLDAAIEAAARASVDAYNTWQRWEGAKAIDRAGEYDEKTFVRSDKPCLEESRTQQNSSSTPCKEMGGTFNSSNGECSYTYRQWQYAPKLIRHFKYYKCNYDTKSCAWADDTIEEVGDFEECGTFANGESLPDSLYQKLIALIGTNYTITIGGGTDTMKNPSRTVTIGTGDKAEVGTGGIREVIDEFNYNTGYSSEIIDPGAINRYPFIDAWKMNYAFEPEMYYWYQEPIYRAMELTHQLELNGLIKIDDEPTYKYCVGEVSKDYKLCNNSESGWQDSLELDDTYVIKQVYACNLDGCSMMDYVQSLAVYAKQDMDAKGDFITPTQYYTLFPTGTIVTARKGTDVPNGEEIENGLPVEPTTEGVRNYILWVKNLGEYYNDGSLGRIWGDSNSVVAHNLQEASACRTEKSALVYDKKVDDFVIEGGSYGLYACEYDVNICCDPVCPTTVTNTCVTLVDKEGITHFYDDKGKEVQEPEYRAKCCPEGKCPVRCTNCLFNNMDYHQVTNEDLNPNDREMGRNWNWDENINTAVELKAYVTTKEIEDNGNSIYDVNFDNPDDVENFAMEVLMDAKMMSKIRAYNKDPETEGYLNNTMECYDLDSDNDVYKNVFCYSTFIDYLVDDETTSKNIHFAIPKLGDKRPRTPAERKANSDKYFSSWVTAEFDTTDWEVTTERGIAYYQSYYGKVYDEATKTETNYHVGPSWK